ncbi:unnamed protein product [Thlaspi arvense]|uniref:Pyruvate kinase C-terminal domain-containing protein n=1 Tax=Thlaspi arvense TaxID=13288 RepID=A0AAU9S2U4_THLAR|nr:unnamed protein product [Thlaspi arvense]
MIEDGGEKEKCHEAMELPDIASSFSDSIIEEICNSAAKMGTFTPKFKHFKVDALFVFTKTGHMASLLSRCRPDCPIFAFTTTTSVRRHLNLQGQPNRTFSLLKSRGMVKSGDLIIAVSDMLQSIQVMNVP